MRLKEIQQIFRDELKELYPKEEIDSFFSILLEEYTGLKLFTLALSPEEQISKTKEGLFFEALSRLKIEEPIQYIIGKTYFATLELVVDNSVLIPRPETEELVKWIVNDELLLQKKELKILDIGTGSGCIAIALAKKMINATVDAIDVSKKALDIAKLNAKKNEVAINFRQLDILIANELADNYDVIVSNPPYVRSSEKTLMKKNVLDYEPHTALFITDEDPLLFYKKITALAVDNLNQGGQLFFEINQYLSNSMTNLLKEFNFKNIELRKDTFDNYRMIRGIR